MRDLGRIRFENQLARVIELFNLAKDQENQALWLFQNDLRTPFFMLQGLARLYAQAHNSKRFTKMKERFKTIEDALGKLDYIDSLCSQFKTKRSVPKSVKLFFEEKRDSELKNLNKLLKKEDWYNGKRIKKISTQLKDINWKTEDKEVELIREIYQREIKNISDELRDKNFIMKDMEDDIHEFRRDIRWLSIYAHALSGLVKLKAPKGNTDHLIKYQRKDILASPYNKLHYSKSLEYHLSFSKPHFIALSWFLAELGKIKDNGLAIHALQQALIQAEGLSLKQAKTQTYAILGKQFPKEEILLKSASTIVKDFFSENILDGLVIS